MNAAESTARSPGCPDTLNAEQRAAIGFGIPARRERSSVPSQQLAELR